MRRYKFIGYKTFAITHSSDNRYSDEGAIVSHDKDSLDAVPVSELLPLRSHTAYKDAKVIAIEEAHFFNDLYDFVIAAVEEDNKHVICVGLNGDYLRKPIGEIGRLIPLADTITKIDALCVYCKEPRSAIFTRRFVHSPRGGEASGKQIIVGGADIYEAVCRRHFLKID
jgi:thymidine kinase